jgi:hypothetical protein
MIVEMGKGVQQGLLCPFIRSGLWAGSSSYARAVSKAGGNEHADRRKSAIHIAQALYRSRRKA